MKKDKKRNVAERTARAKAQRNTTGKIGKRKVLSQEGKKRNGRAISQVLVKKLEDIANRGVQWTAGAIKHSLNILGKGRKLLLAEHDNRAGILHTLPHLILPYNPELYIIMPVLHMRTLKVREVN